MKNRILIINTGGTFNKRYNQKIGSLDIQNDNKYIDEIISNIYKSNKKPKIKGLIYKDSLDITKQDRLDLIKFIKNQKEKNIIIIHGTDTMSKTAHILYKNIIDKNIILVGSMIPYSINKIEAIGNLAMAIGFIKNINNSSVYICMNGMVKKYTKIKKDYDKSVFKAI